MGQQQNNFFSQLKLDEEIKEMANKLIELTNETTSSESSKGVEPFFQEVKLLHSACNSFYNYLTKLENNKSNNTEEIIKRGTVLLFQIRKFITGESLKFVVAGTTSKNNLKERAYTQEQIMSEAGLSNLTVSMSNGQVELASQLERLKSLEDAKTSLNQQWQKILKYGFTENYKEEEHITDIDGQEKGNKVTYNFYKKASADINVYIRFVARAKRNTITYYYNLQENVNINEVEQLKGMKSYDTGWLYQWLKLHSKVEIDEGSYTPLKALMTADTSIRENVPGIKGGDNLVTKEQYKHQNLRIITINNIKDILNGRGKYYGIIESLKLLMNKESFKEGLKKLVLDFSTANEDNITNFVAESFKNCLTE